MPTTTGAKPRSLDLEIKDAQLIFQSVWRDLETEYGRENLRFAKELILLGGAPGAGKGTQTDFILQTRGLTCPPIVVSALLDTPEMRRIKDEGGLVGDRQVVGIVFRKLLEPEFRDGAVLDGFPRTKAQIECLKLLVQKINELHREFQATPLAIHFRKPTIHIMVLFVSERVSVERQLYRGRQISEHNAKVRESGVGDLLEERATDLDPETARRRYRVFKEQTWDALQSLKKTFFYHFIDAEGPIREVQENILRELQYQSTLELDPRTYDQVRRLPVASDIVRHARQELVRRLDGYALTNAPLFHQVLEFCQRKILPIVERHAISGMALVNTEDALLDDPLALAMLIDVFSERGFHAVVDVNRQEVPERFDLQTGEIRCRVKKIYRIRINFQGSEIRRG